MTVDRSTTLAFDAACLVAAAGSPSGGSGFLVGLCQRGDLSGAVSRLIIAEAERNVRSKMGAPAALELDRILNAADLRRVVVRVGPSAAVVNIKDRHVLAAALEAGAQFLVTLDRRFAAEVESARLAVIAVTPGEFIRGELRTHPDFPFAHH